MSRKTNLILFDVGGVLLTTGYNDFHEAAAAKSPYLDAEGFKQAYNDNDLEARAVLGEVNAAQFCEELRNMIKPEKELSYEELKELFGLCFTEQDDKMIKLKEKVHRAGYSVGILSNMSDLVYEILSEKWPDMFETFGGPRILSFQVGVIKPFLPIYQLIEGYDKVVYVDDRKVYVETPVRELGWYGIWFTAFLDPGMYELKNLQSTERQPEQFRTANSVKELEDSLRYFGVRI